MTSSNLGLIIEILVAGLLVMTIAYCALLNNRLKNLRADEQILKSTISELFSATEVAERAIIGLKSTTQEAEKHLGQKLRDAQLLHAELKRLTTSGALQPPKPHYESHIPPATVQSQHGTARPAETQPATRQVSAALESLDKELNEAVQAKAATSVQATKPSSLPSASTAVPRDFRVFTRSAFSSRTGGN